MSAAQSKRCTWARWLARSVGTCFAVSWVFIVMFSGIGEGWPDSWEGWAMAVLVLASVSGVVLGWWRERIGGIVLIAISVAQVSFVLEFSGRNYGWAVLIATGPGCCLGSCF